MNKDHKHYAVWREMMERVLAGKPHNVQWRGNADGSWHDTDTRPDGTAALAWTGSYEYRIKPDMVRLGRHEFPRPLTEPPADGTRVWIALADGHVVNWEDFNVHSMIRKNYFTQGRVHLTEEAAQAHCDAERAWAADGFTYVFTDGSDK